MALRTARVEPVPDALRLALGTLTALRVPAPQRVNRRVAGQAMVLAPLAGLPLALGVVMVAGLLRWAGASPLLAAVLALALLVLGTRGMHLDGLADTADGLSSGYDRERALDVMRRSDIGPSGVAAVVLVLLVDAAALSSLAGSEAGIAVAGLCVLLSRHGLTWACRAGVPPARASGLGATVAGTVPRGALAGACATVLGLAVAVGLGAGGPWWFGPALWAVAVLATLAVLRRCTARLGGVTGDVLGAVVEVGLAASLALASVLLPHVL